MPHRIHAILSCLLVFVLLLALALTSFAKSKIDGDWEGSTENGKFFMVFHIQLNGPSTVDSPKQNIPIHGMPVNVNLTGKTVHIAIPSGAANFEGTLNGSRIIGTFSQGGPQGGEKSPMTLTRSSKRHN